MDLPVEGVEDTLVGQLQRVVENLLVLDKKKNNGIKSSLDSM